MKDNPISRDNSQSFDEVVYLSSHLVAQNKNQPITSIVTNLFENWNE